MQTVLELPPTAIRTSNGLKNIIFQAIKDDVHAVFFDVPWKIYVEIIEETPARRNPRLFYDQGTLEIMPLFKHDRPNRILSLIVEEIAGVLQLDTEDCGSTTLRQNALTRGFEPDTGFYFGTNAKFIRQKAEIDLEFDPPPDLIIEVDVTSSSLNRFQLFAAVRIPEIWVFENERLKVFTLQSGAYLEVGTSEILKGVSGENLTDFVARSRTLEKFEWREMIKNWARENLKG